MYVNLLSEVLLRVCNCNLFLCVIGAKPLVLIKKRLADAFLPSLVFSFLHIVIVHHSDILLWETNAI